MKKLRSLALFLFAGILLLSSCQKDDEIVAEVVTFESLSVPVSGYWNGSDKSGSFTSGKLTLPNYYNSSWETWSGFSYSQQNNVSTPGFENQYSVFSKTNGKNTFAIYYPSWEGDAFISFPDHEMHGIRSMDICNTTYSALSMKNGDSYCKKFGGTTGNDPDWFKVDVSGYDKDGTKTGTVTVYLSDFRASNAAGDYILDKWTTIDLSALGRIHHIGLEFSSTDAGAYGINTPTYLCLDNVKYIP